MLRIYKIVYHRFITENVQLIVLTIVLTSDNRAFVLDRMEATGYNIEILNESACAYVRII